MFGSRVGFLGDGGSNGAIFGWIKSKIAAGSELSEWLCHDDSTIDIGVVIIIIIIIIIIWEHNVIHCFIPKLNANKTTV